VDTINSFLHMPGPQFLAFYTVFATIVTLLSAIWSRRTDAAPSAYLPSVPDAKSDPYEVAWLQGGTARVLLTGVFSLLQRGSIRLDGTSSGELHKTAGGPPPNGAVETFVHGVFKNGTTVKSLLKDQAILAGVERICAPFESKYTQAGLVTTSNEWRRAFSALATGVLVVVGLAALKIAIALSTGHSNIVFLVLLAILFAVVIPVVCWPKRLNAKGRAYTKSNADAYGSLARGGGLGLTASADYGSLPLYVAVAGAPVLLGTQYDAFRRAVVPPSASGGCSTSSCSSGSSCSGGSSCGGGGCGGCGGS
jgi:uncharacterized protein (TIGR04222 family)